MKALTTMSILAADIKLSGIRFDRAASLPRPNIYWCTAQTRDGHRFDTYLAGDHTKVAARKFQNWCVDHHAFRPTRMNSDLKMRRVLLGDIIESPEVYDIALKNARDACQSDIVAALEALPSYIRSVVGLGNVPLNKCAADRIWDAMAVQLEEMQAPVRVLRA